MAWNSCGYNGSGKSTAINLITRLYDVTKGQILINGYPIQSYSSSCLRKRMIVLLQDNARFDMSLREWISLGDIESIGKEGQEEKLREALEKSDARQVVDKLLEGLDTRLGPTPLWDTEESFLNDKIEEGEFDKGDESDDESDEVAEDEDEQCEKMDSGIATPTGCGESDRDSSVDESPKNKPVKPRKTEKASAPMFSGGE
jgi:hypothetical protein